MIIENHQIIEEKGLPCLVLVIFPHDSLYIRQCPSCDSIFPQINRWALNSHKSEILYELRVHRESLERKVRPHLVIEQIVDNVFGVLIIDNLVGEGVEDRLCYLLHIVLEIVHYFSDY